MAFGARTALAAVASVGILACLGAAPAAAQVLPTEIEVRTAPASLSYPGNAQFSYEVELTTGGQPVHIGIFWTTPEWPGGWEFEGTPLELKQPTLLGPGQMRDPREFFVNFQLAYGIVGACLRGRARNRTYDADGRELHLPANSTATLRAPAKLTSGRGPRSTTHRCSRSSGSAPRACR